MTLGPDDPPAAPPTLGYAAPPPPPRRRFFTPAGWFVLSGYLAFGAFSMWFAMNNRIGRVDVAVVIGAAVASALALFAGLRSLRRNRAGG